MNQSELERAVARATGESRRFVKQFGFSLVDDEPRPGDELTLAIDCPGCGAVCDGAIWPRGLSAPGAMPSIRSPSTSSMSSTIRTSHSSPAPDHFAFQSTSQGSQDQTL